MPCLCIISRGPLEGLRRIKLTCIWNSHLLRLIFADNSTINVNMRSLLFQLKDLMYRTCSRFRINQPFPFWLFPIVVPIRIYCRGEEPAKLCDIDWNETRGVTELHYRYLETVHHQIWWRSSVTFWHSASKCHVLWYRRCVDGRLTSQLKRPAVLLLSFLKLRTQKNQAMDGCFFLHSIFLQLEMSHWSK